MSESCTFRVLYNRILEKFSSLNLFDSRSSDPTIIRREIYSTRLLIMLLIISVFILTLYTSVSVQTKSETVKWPSQSVYEHLLKRYPSTLQCPCANISILHGKFMDIIPFMHQVCSSTFVSQRWIDHSFAANTTFIWPIDIRTSLSAMWQMIGLLCHSARDAFDDVFSQFTNSTTISPFVLSEELIKANTRASFNLMFQTASSAWLRPLTTLLRMTQANGFMTGLITNYVAIQSGRLVDETRFVETKMNTYKLKGTNQSCSCQTNGSCPITAGFYLYNMKETYGIYDLNIIQPNSTLTGIVINCLPMQTTLDSSLECFYNESCMNILFSVYSRPHDISLLDASLPSRFSPTVNIALLINELFIEEIFNETIYKKYYHECTPMYCTFTYSRRFDWVFVITTLIALLGGLYTALHLISPYLVDFILFLKNRGRSNSVEHQPNASKMFHNIECFVIKISFF